jgi:hypothetical protein
LRLELKEAEEKSEQLQQTGCKGCEDKVAIEGERVDRSQGEGCQFVCH